MSSTHNPATLAFLKKDQARRRKQRAIASVVGLVMVAGIAVGGYLAYGKGQATEQAAAQNVSVDIPATADPREAWQKLRAAVEAGTLTEDQAREAGRAAMEKQQQAVMDGYFNTPAKDREKYLDKLIDEEQKRMAEWRRDRPTTNPSTQPNRGDRNGPTSRPNRGNDRGDDTPGEQAARESRNRARADNTSPMQRAQRDEFQAAKRARESERGIEGGRGGGGGGGRGFGGGGGGRGR